MTSSSRDNRLSIGCFATAGFEKNLMKGTMTTQMRPLLDSEKMSTGPFRKTTAAGHQSLVQGLLVHGAGIAASGW